MDPKSDSWEKECETNRGNPCQYAGLVLFAAIWLAVLTVPSLRLNVLGSRFGRLRELGLNGFTLPDYTIKFLLKHHPNDARVLARVAESKTKDARELVQKYDALIKRFPNNAWLIANRIRFTTGFLPLDRAEPTMGNRQAPVDEKSFAPAEIAQAIEITREGRKLEPDNCFFDWMLAFFLYLDRGDEEAIAVLHEGGMKQRYDSHVQDDLRASVAVQELVHPLSVVEKIASSTPIGFSPLATHRTLAKWAAQEASRAKAAGNHQRALTILSDVARLGSHMVEATDCDVIQGMVGLAIQNIPWRVCAPKSSSTYPKLHGNDVSKGLLAVSQDNIRGIQFWSSTFARYADEHDRPDLAEETRHEAQSAIQFQKESVAYLTGPSAQELHLLEKIGTFGEVCGFILGAVVLMSLGWFVLFLYTRRAANREGVSKPKIRFLSHAALWTYRRGMGAIAIVGSMVYIVCSLAMLRPLHQIEQQLDARIQHGEMALIREQHPKPTTAPRD